MAGLSESRDARVAVLVDCDNVPPVILDHALRFVAQFGRVVVRRGYGNSMTLGAARWQDALTQQAFTPCLQYQYASGKNTADIALALDAMEMLFDEIVDTFCIVTSDSDFAHLCRKLRERGALVCIVGEEKTPSALRNASDHFSQWEAVVESGAGSQAKPGLESGSMAKQVDQTRSSGKQRPMLVVKAVAMLAGDTPEGKVSLSALGNYLRRTDPSFTPSTYGHSGLLDMLRTYDLLQSTQEPGGHWVVKLDQEKISKMPVNPLTGKPSVTS
ncbi:NYN domain-containing protein [Pseudoxanthomonas mexicana]|uniref:NYN domain-containing protein n=1 Tax=Pseudoxanthomonas mexicana TaxID=128785 RepID=UPI000785B743|nr:NYN domain-containing protein [Pseudoxanthomonas mexicana]